MVFADDQILRHEFTIQNASDRPMRLIRATALTPCCSSLGQLPEAIPPKGAARISATFQPGYRSGPKVVVFLIETDSENQGQFGLALRAELVSAWEAERLQNQPAYIPVGQPGGITFRVIARRKGSSGRALPESISAAPPVTAAFSGQAASRTGPDGTIEATREVVVSLPATSEPGLRRGELAFAWPDGRTERMPLGWEVRPRLRSTPSGLVFPRSDRPVERTIVVESDGLPFRVVGVGSPLLAVPVNLPDGRGTRHTIQIKLSVLNATRDRTTDVVIATDHPDQPSINLSVLVLPDAEGRGG
jgi:hypothetical protein